MRKTFATLSVAVSSLFIYMHDQQSSFAADIPPPVDFETADDWEVSVSPFYLWLLGFNGTMGAGGNTAKVNITPIDLYINNFGNFLDALDGVYMGTGEIRKGDFGFYYDIVYADLLTGQALSNNVLQANVDVGFSFALGTVMGTYRAIDTGQAHVDAMAGLRVSNVELSIGAALSGGSGRTARAKSTWVDPAIGLKFGYDYSENLSLTGWGIVGGFGAGSDLFWDVFGGAEYYFNDQLSALVGFRGGGTDYKNSNIVYDVTNWGPMLGLGLKLGPTASRSDDTMAQPSSQDDLDYDWSGAYAGVALGYYGGVDEISAMPFSLFNGAPRPASNRNFSARARGFVGGGFLGYNFQMPDSPFVLGIEGDISGIAAKDSGSSNVRLGRVTSMRAKGKNNFAWSLRGRLGYSTGAFMPYITGGYAGLSAKTSLTLTQATGSATQSKTNTYSGWTFGGGLDFMMSPSIVLGAEFRHANYGAKTNNFAYPGVGVLPSGTGVSVRTKIFDNQILVRGAYRF